MMQHLDQQKKPVSGGDWTLTSRNVRCASVAFWNASKIFFTATVSRVRLSIACRDPGGGRS